MNEKRPRVRAFILRRDWDSNPGTKILGHSLAGCCITTLPPLHFRTGRRLHRGDKNTITLG